MTGPNADARDAVPIAVWSGSFQIFGVDVKCHTLSDGQRIIEADSMLALMAALADPVDYPDTEDAHAFLRWQKGANGRETG